MRAFIKVQDEKAWKAILSGWSPLSKNGSTKFEGTEDAKRSKFIMLQTRFDDLRMTESETLSKFYERLPDISNEYFTLSEKLNDSVLVRKIVRVLPDRFNIKLTTMEEAKDFSTMKVEKLMGSLRTFELNHKIRSKEKPSISKEKEPTSWS
uniref:Gag-pol polyprotein n=1 Tax=Cannabis sativa TaxID=3483 RepID=A0A803QE32_CANSA